jgi:L-rhamnose mutarotase
MRQHPGGSAKGQEPPEYEPGAAMIRKAFMMSVNAGQEAEYERRHRPIWKELEQTLKDHGVHSYSIFLHPQTRQLFGYVEFESLELWHTIAATDVCRRWWAYMKDIMPSNSDNSPQSLELPEVFHIAKE